MSNDTRSPSELLAELDTERAQADAEPEADDFAPVPRRKNIHVRYRTGDGTVLEGVCVYEVPGTEAYLRIGALEARMSLGLPLQGLAATLVHQIAYLEVTLGDRRPDWMRDDLRKVPDPRLIGLIYEEARQHEARFLEHSGDLRPGPMARA